MLDVSDETIRAYTEYGVDKHITISFPNDNISTITNENIKEESLSLSRAICSENAFKVQGCNAAQFKITTFDITEDLTNKNIIVTLSIKDEHYKGVWQKDGNYAENDIVKFDDHFYEYAATPPDNESEYIKRDILDLSALWKEQENKYTTDGRFAEGLKGIKISGISNISTNVDIKVKTWFNNGPYYKIYQITGGDNNKDIVFAQKDSSGNPLAGWFIEISNNGLESEDFINFISGISIIENSSIKQCNVYPNLSEYCEEKFGYYDTSESEDLVIFRGKIDSYTKQSQDPRYKEIIAYDKFYELQNKSIRSWINTLDSNGKGYIELYDYQGAYKQETEYKANQTVYEETTVNGKTVKYFYRFKKTYDFPNFQKMSLADVYNTTIGGTQYGKQYIQRLSNYYPNRPTLKEIRDDLCKKFGLVQKATVMNRDSQKLTIKKFSKEYSVTKMLQWICNANLTNAILDPTENKIKYVSIFNFNLSERNEYYKGDFDPENALNYVVGDVVKYTNKYNETRYYECVRTMKDSTFPNKFEISDINFIKVTSKTMYLPLIPNDKWYIEFNFDDEMAMEYEVEISIGNASTSKKIVQSCKINLQELMQNSSKTFSISINNVTEDFWNTFSAKMYTATGAYDANWDLSDDELKDFWKPKNLLYHPNGRINISNLYEIDNIEITEDLFEYKGVYVTETENENTVLYGEEDKNNNKVAISYSPLFESWTTKQFYKTVNAPSNYAAYQPFKLACLGLPFLEPGDLITFDIDEWYSDENGESVVQNRTINSVVLEKNMTGLNYLKDEYSAKKE